jgi:hypothetical protein
MICCVRMVENSSLFCNILTKQSCSLVMYETGDIFINRSQHLFIILFLLTLKFSLLDDPYQMLWLFYNGCLIIMLQ